MTIDDKIKDEKQQFNINREGTKTSALSSGKNDKCEYLTGEVLLPSCQSRIIEQAKFTYYPLSRAFEKQIRTIEEGIKQAEGLKALKPEENWKQLKLETRNNWRNFSRMMENNEIKNELDEIKKLEEKIKRKEKYMKNK